MNMKTVLKFDSGRKSFDKAIFILLILAVIIAVLGAFWIYPFFSIGGNMNISIEYCNM